MDAILLNVGAILTGAILQLGDLTWILLEQPRVDNSNVGSLKRGAQLGAIGPICLRPALFSCDTISHCLCFVDGFLWWRCIANKEDDCKVETITSKGLRAWFGLLLLWLWCLTPLSTILQLYRGGQFYWWRKPEYKEKTNDLSEIRQTLSHNMLSSTPRLSEIRTHNVIGDMHWLHSKPNYHIWWRPRRLLLVCTWLTVTECLYHSWPPICSVCRYEISSFIIQALLPDF